jgi:hypothetical protein
VRVLNHVPIEKWVKLGRNGSSLVNTADGDEYSELLCSPGAVQHGCIVQRTHGGAHFGQALAAYGRLHTTHRVTMASDALHRWAAKCNTELRGTSPSGGLFAVLLALATCARPVSVYGYWPFCCKPRPGGQPMNYKYHQGNRTRRVCCSKGRERMEVEFGFYQQLARRKVIRLVTAPRHITGALP